MQNERTVSQVYGAQNLFCAFLMIKDSQVLYIIMTMPWEAVTTTEPEVTESETYCGSTPSLVARAEAKLARAVASKLSTVPPTVKATVTTGL